MQTTIPRLAGEMIPTLFEFPLARELVVEGPASYAAGGCGLSRNEESRLPSEPVTRLRKVRTHTQEAQTAPTRSRGIQPQR